MLTLTLLVMSSLGGDVQPAARFCTPAAVSSAVTVSNTLALADSLDALPSLPRVNGMLLKLAVPRVLAARAPQVSLWIGLPRLSLDWLRQNRLSLKLSLSLFSVSRCLATQMWSGASVPLVHTLVFSPVGLGAPPPPRLSPLAPLENLLTRLAERANVHAMVGVETGVSARAEPAGTARMPARTSAPTTVQAPAPQAPVVPRVVAPSVPQISPPQTNKNDLRPLTR